MLELEWVPEKWLFLKTSSVRHRHVIPPKERIWISELHTNSGAKTVTHSIRFWMPQAFSSLICWHWTRSEYYILIWYGKHHPIRSLILKFKELFRYNKTAKTSFVRKNWNNYSGKRPSKVSLVCNIMPGKEKITFFGKFYGHTLPAFIIATLKHCQFGQKRPK